MIQEKIIKFKKTITLKCINGFQFKNNYPNAHFIPKSEKSKKTISHKVMLKIKILIMFLIDCIMELKKNSRK